MTRIFLALFSSILLAACAPSSPAGPGPSPGGPDWVNPTSMSVRGCDALGCGHFGAPRSIGTHKGSDYSAAAGQTVVAATSGVIDKIGYPYADDLSFRYIRIVADDGYTVRQLYVLPAAGIEVGEPVTAGEVIGTEQTLSGRYPGITEHSHTDIKKDGAYENPETLIP